jgi:hypothetical protein
MDYTIERTGNTFRIYGPIRTEVRGKFKTQYRSNLKRRRELAFCAVKFADDGDAKYYIGLVHKDVPLDQSAFIGFIDRTETSGSNAKTITYVGSNRYTKYLGTKSNVLKNTVLRRHYNTRKNKVYLAKGIAGILLTHVLAVLQQEGKRLIVLQAVTPDLQGYYERFGFVSAGPITDEGLGITYGVGESGPIMYRITT